MTAKTDARKLDAATQAHQPRQLGTLCVGQYDQCGNAHWHSPLGSVLHRWNRGVPISPLKNATPH